MATAKDVYNVCQNAPAYGAGCFTRVDEELKAYKRARCYHPIKVKVFDSHLGEFVVREVPCGNCYHCRETKQNEWVTRLYAHCEDYKYVYFITLTYRSFDPNIHTPYLDYLRDYLRGAEFLPDSNNAVKRYCDRPTILCKSHYQNFLKRLRHNTDQKGITYLVCGEYGSNYGSPHFHAILFSHEPISKADITRAWGLVVSEKDGVVVPSKNGNNKRFLPFGRIDYADLVENGTITNKSVVVDGRNMSARKCFAYVAKYCCKRKYNTYRVKLLYDYLQNSVEDYEKIDSVTDQSNWFDFQKAHRPFISVSRGIPIGSLWLSRHIKEVAEDNCPRPPLQKQGSFIVPSYFRRKASESVYSLRLSTESIGLRKGNIPALAKTLSAYVKEDLTKVFDSIPNIPDAKITNFPFHDYRTIELNTDKLLRSPDCFVDIYTKHRFLLAIETSIGGSLLDTFVCEYKYIRGKGWSYVRSHSLESWCLHYLSSMPADFASYLAQLKKSQESEYYYNLVKEFYLEFDMLDKFLDMSNVVEHEAQTFFEFKNSARYQNSVL